MDHKASIYLFLLTSEQQSLLYYDGTTKCSTGKDYVLVQQKGTVLTISIRLFTLFNEHDMIWECRGRRDNLLFYHRMDSLSSYLLKKFKEEIP